MVDLPAKIEWGRVLSRKRKMKATASVSAYIDKNKTHVARLSLTASAMIEAGFKENQRMLLHQGKAPHNNWLKIQLTTSENWGVKFNGHSGAHFGIKSFLKPGIKLDHVIEPLIEKGAIYIELPKSWVA